MTKTVHVIPRNGQWTVKREGRKAGRVFSTKSEAVKDARVTLRREGSGQIVVHDSHGRISEMNTYSMPPIQDPPGRKSAKIERAVGKITRNRLYADSLPPRSRD